MKVYEISYDLLGSWWHCLDSTWLVECNLSAKQIRDRLAKHLDGNDKMLVARLAGEAAWTGFDQECSSWLVNQLNAASRAQ